MEIKSRDQLAQALPNRAPCGVDHNAVAIPLMIFTRENRFPGRQNETCDVGAAKPHPPLVLRRIRANNFDFNDVDSTFITHRTPGVARLVNRVH